MGFPYSKKQYLAKKKTKKTTKKPTTKKAIVKLIKKEIAVEAETKFANYDVAVDALINGNGIATPAGTGGYVSSNLIPTISQGNGAADRQGNKITTRSFLVRGVVQSYPYSVTTNTNLSPFFVDVYIVSNKATNSITIPTVSNLFRVGNNTEAYDGSFINSMDQFNTVAWTKHYHKRFRMDARNGPGYNTAITAAGGSIDGLNNKHAMIQQFKAKIPLPKHLLYNDAAVNQPNNKSFWLIAGYINMDGVIDTNVQNRATLSVQSILGFDDI